MSMTGSRLRRLMIRGLSLGAPALLVLGLPAPALADHMSGGTPDVMGAFGATSLVLIFVGLLGVLGHWPGRFKLGGRRWGLVALVAGLATLAGGSWYTAGFAGPEEELGGAIWGRLVVQQFVGLFLVFGGFSAAVVFWATRQGVLGFGEQAKYGILTNGEPGDPAAALPPRQKAEWLVWLPVAGMAALALLIAGGLAYVALVVVPG